MFVLRYIVRRNPWLLGEGFATRRGAALTLGPLQVDVSGEIELLPAQKARLIAEANAGTLFR
jgi:hypothetical protein